MAASLRVLAAGLVLGLAWLAPAPASAGLRCSEVEELCGRDWPLVGAIVEGWCADVRGSCEPDALDPLSGVEAWFCLPEGKRYSDGHCYLPDGACNPAGPRLGGVCSPGSWHETPCACPADGLSPAHGEALGLGLLYFNEGGYHIVVADLSSPDLEVRVDAPRGTSEENALTVAEHAEQAGALVAINANYFGGPSNYPCGAARGTGRQFLDAYAEDGNCVTSLGWSRWGGELFDSSGREGDWRLRRRFTELVTGGGPLLEGGRRSEWNRAKLTPGRSCSAVGLSADRKRFLFVVADLGVCTGEGLQDALLAHGAADALQLDGGGSSRLWIAGRGYVNDEPSLDRRPPVVVYARPLR
ncbi:MAG: phosphodiester glycosidase family protein [Elusimicrobia bacterium]|nr:phosphodiester glycosidase family protein [Elusimicrobiota bacterium]